ncbi:MAG: glutathione S-transferase family protein [Rhodocyclaceae bacterium]|nr:glutathione S-transferase family protein [Pseudomonadota bacterium]MDQ7972567.1 glutathione S-transferase family protein [Rhodocyclaceae bacterium]MDQ8000365.1 glutathione S-transferase family protein [Pseudomonadota bacterium]MDQ8019005.1 glutathione S-transferase family protein [Pseudomonadota bacterium]
MFTLYSGPLSMFGAKAQIAALEKGLPFELVMVPFDADDRYRPRHPEVLRVNPKEQVPVLVDGDLDLFDSTQIFEYLEDLAPEPPLWPREPRARARARRLEMESDEVFFPWVVRLFGLQDAMDSAPAIAARSACAQFQRRLEEQWLADGRDWLCGPYGHADIAFYMAQLFAERKGAGLTGDMTRLIAWRERMTQRPAVREVAGAMARFLHGAGRPVPGFLARLVPAA